MWWMVYTGYDVCCILFSCSETITLVPLCNIYNFLSELFLLMYIAFRHAHICDWLYQYIKWDLLFKQDSSVYLVYTLLQFRNLEASFMLNCARCCNIPTAFKLLLPVVSYNLVLYMSLCIDGIEPNRIYAMVSMIYIYHRRFSIKLYKLDLN